jgi:hypothetical protein
MQVESSGRKLFFAFSPSCGGGDDSAAAATEVTLGLIKSRGEKEEDCCPVISVPKDQHGLRTLLFCNADSWIPEVVPFLGQLISTGHPLLLKAHNETGFMPRFSEITGRVYIESLLKGRCYITYLCVGARPYKSGLFYLRERLLNCEFKTKAEFYHAAILFYQHMKRYCEVMERTAGRHLAPPLPKQVG